MGSPVADFSALKTILRKAKNIVVLTGAGVSAESGIPTFRGSGGFWRTYQSQDLATVGAFNRSPSLVWEFYHYRRELVLTKEPNKAHLAIAEAEETLKKEGRKLTVITQNIDGLHQRAGSKNVIELHGSLFKTLCLKCYEIHVNNDSPICPALEGKGAPDLKEPSPEIPSDLLPRCKTETCGGLLRPYVVWFGENLHPDTLEQADTALRDCEACLLVGTSSVVYPAAMYAPELARRNIPVAEFNLEATPATHNFMFHFPGACTETIPKALSGISKAEGETSIEDETKGEKKEVKLTGAQKLKQAVRDYGSTVIIFHVGISLISLGGIYLAFSSGLDMNWLVKMVGLDSGGKLAIGASTFVISYAVHKVFAPIRISITLAATPFIVKYLRSIGFLKPPKVT